MTSASGGTRTAANRRAVVAWTLYDFANSAFVAVIPATVYSKYYALAVVGNERGEGDFWWGLSVTTSMVLVALSAPPMGAIADHTGLRKRFLFILTYASVAATALMATVGPGDVLRGWVLAVIGTVGFEAAIVYYNAYLPGLAPRQRQGRLSAYGFAVGYLGSAVALGAALPFALRGSYAGAFLSAAALFGAFAIPAFVWLPGDRPGALSLREAVGVGFTRTQATLRRIARMPDLRRFLLAYLFFEDGVNTVVYFSAVFAGHTLGFSTTEVILLYFVVQLTALGGAWAWGRPTDLRGPKFVVTCTLVQWCVVVVAAYVVQTKAQFFILAIVAGTGLGAIQAASRTFMATLIPPGQEAELFGFYALCGKAAAVFGPMVFGLASRLTGGNQRIAIVAIGVFFLAGLGLLRGVRAGGPTHAPAHAAPASTGP
ncbi:MAG: MFS transporter [Candidatus Rokubacteria bacterium]|nr:MFS transporter [Candidatus Rokubacteria bacterium]